MARADLLVSLVQSGFQGDKVAFKRLVEAITAEERSKQHHGLAKKLEEILLSSDSQSMNGSYSDRKNGFLSESGSLFDEIIPRRKISDLILPDKIVKICTEIVEEQHRADLLRSYNLEPRNKILMIGPPGNGKTSLAEAVAESLMVPFYVVRYENLVGAYLGETATRLRKLFEHIVTRQCVLFFDEFETLGKERGDKHETGEIKRVVSSLLMQIDSLPSHAIIIGATNHPELLDRATWRRFQVRLEVPQPTLTSIKKWFDKFEKRIDCKLGYSHEALAKRLKGANFAEIEEFGLTAFRKYVLSQPSSNMKNVISNTLKDWSARTAKRT